MIVSQVTISIGRNVGLAPATLARWTSFQSAVRGALDEQGADILVDAAISLGHWGGHAEDSATWVATLDSCGVVALRADLRDICRAFSQDAIAFATSAPAELLA